MAGVLSRLKRSFELRFPRLASAGGYVRRRKKRFIALTITVAHVVGALTSVQAIMNTRTAQGAVAWAVSLNTFPYLAVPAYWVFGRSKFEGSVTKRRGGEEKAHPLIVKFIDRAEREGLVVTGRDDGSSRVAVRLAKLPATDANQVDLLRDGSMIFPSIFEGIGRAKSYVLLQFYIVKDDTLGRQLQQHLIAAARRGVAVHFVYDEIGSHGLPSSYITTLQEAGVEMIPFNTTQGITNRFQINFRNHRKVVITDGRTAWTGSANIGDEYLGSGSGGQTASLDTMVKIEGPAVQTIQVSFWEDWLWASGRMLELEWTPQPAASGANRQVLCVPSGPADPLETCTLYFLQLISSAKERLWIASPYFVPDEQLVSALELAALRGVEVRILVPDEGDSRLVELSGWAYVERLGKVGVRFYRHTRDFMHQKVTLVDSDLATVGSANFDNRSFRLNFEMTMEIRDQAFASEVAAMLEKDFAEARLVDPGEARTRGFLFELKVRSAILLSPIQ